MSRIAQECQKCQFYYPGECMKLGCQDRYCECDGCNAGEGVVFSKLSNKNTPSQSIVKVDPEGSCKKDNGKQINNHFEIETKDKFILDVCCGLRAMWFNKNHPNTIYLDKRIRNKGFDDFRPNFEINPDYQVDWHNLPFQDNTFKLVVMDPPHIITEEDSHRMVKYYGHLNKETWKTEIKSGFDECFRVLEDKGILIFKWSEASIKKKELLEVLEIQPLFGHPNGSRVPCHWLTFMKGVSE
jgi:hypothetical protein